MMNKTFTGKLSILSKTTCQSYTKPSRCAKLYEMKLKTNTMVSCRIIPCVHFMDAASDKTKEIKTISLDKTKQTISGISKQWNHFYQKYEQFIGLTDVQNAQNQVQKREEHFLQARAEERRAVREVLAIRDQLKHVRERLSHVNYSNPLYPQLANEQHELVTKEEGMKLTLENAEENERDSFQKLSAAMRNSYEKERARVEQTKNWSLIGSIIGTILGMIGGSYINRVRTNDLRHMIVEHDHSKDIQEDIAKVLPFVHERYEDIKDSVSQLQACLVRGLLDNPPEENETEGNTMVFRQFDVQLKELKALCNSISVRLQHQTSPTTTSTTVTKTLSELNQKLERLEELLGKETKSEHLVQKSSNDQESKTEITQAKVDNLPNADSSQFGLSSPVTAVLWGAIITAVYYIITV
uniref:Coiled-coil domain-containing protein 51-like n=1 Tax=Ciona intestinalis TaxID=7719 RepID=A0A1W5BGX7_CIOIN|nr:coiled-coil domain-containing protein 51-like [Ciona intestinalis]|eukprot:XP_026690669.1 coiled-coil domain-containing protein 51-like [Ciona intestinalis]